MAEHSTLTTSQVHEPKHITSSATSDAGKVITPSSVTAGISELRLLAESEITSKKDYLQCSLTDVSTASSVYMVMPFNGTLTKIYSVLQSAISAADSNIVTYINGVAVTNGTMVIAQAGSAAGDLDSATPTANNTFTEGQIFRFASDGASTTAASLEITLVCTRTS